MKSEQMTTQRDGLYYSAYCAKKACIGQCMNPHQTRYDKIKDVHMMRTKRNLLVQRTLYLCKMSCKGHHWDGKKYVCLYNQMIPTDYVLRMKY